MFTPMRCPSGARIDGRPRLAQPKAQSNSCGNKRGRLILPERTVELILPGAFCRSILRSFSPWRSGFFACAFDRDHGRVGARGDGLAELEADPAQREVGEQAPGYALRRRLDQAELAFAQHDRDGLGHGGVVERVGQVVAGRGFSHGSRFRDHIHADEQGLLDVALPGVYADDRIDAEIPDRYEIRHGIEASQCSTPAMCTVAQDLATSGSCAASASRMARCSASACARAPVWVRPRQTRARVVGPDIDSSSEERTELPEQATIRRWNSRSLATSSSAAGSGPMLSSRARRPPLSSAVIRSAAIAVAAGSRMRRTRRNSSSVSSPWKSTMKLSASSSSRGSRLVTYVPSPRRTSRMLTRDRARTASRSELRDSPRSAARSASRGSRSPARSAPDVIMALIFSMASSVTAKPCLRHPVPPERSDV